MSALLDSLHASFAALPAARIDSDGLGNARRAAMALALAEGLPSQRDERWKYTALRALSARSFTSPAGIPGVAADLLSAIPGPRLVFINGQFDASLSDLANVEPGLSLGGLSSPLAAAGQAPMNPAPRARDSGHDAFSRLNIALASDGALVRVAAGARIAAPLHLVLIGAPASSDIASHARHRIELGRNASLSLVEHHLGAAAHRNLDNQWLQLELQDDARLVHARLQDEDAGATLIARTDAVLGARAFYHRVDLELGAALSRHELNVALAGEGSQLQSSGALLAGGRRHVDTRLGISHLARDTRCDLMWRGLAADRGRLVFHGGISIEAGADGSDARLSNKNLLLSADAEIDTQPVLQIHADEVKAAHGATVGRLDATALFYLRSRGIPAAQARLLLTLAFCREALSAIADPALVELLSPRLESRLAGLEAVT